MTTYISKSEKETSDIAQQFLEKLLDDQVYTDNSTENKNEALIVALHGDLGSGKTTFVKALAKHLGIIETVTSPTFVIAKFFRLVASSLQLKASQLIHIDAYRLDSANDLIKLDFEREFNNPENLIIIEWPEKVSEILENKKVIRINFEFVDEEIRKINF